MGKPIDLTDPAGFERAYDEHHGGVYAAAFRVLKSRIRLGLEKLRAEGQITALHVTDFTPAAAGVGC
jgi:hypothetical protein